MHFSVLKLLYSYLSLPISLDTIDTNINFVSNTPIKKKKIVKKGKADKSMEKVLDAFLKNQDKAENVLKNTKIVGRRKWRNKKG